MGLGSKGQTNVGAQWLYISNIIHHYHIIIITITITHRLCRCCLSFSPFLIIIIIIIITSTVVLVVVLYWSNSSPHHRRHDTMVAHFASRAIHQHPNTFMLNAISRPTRGGHHYASSRSDPPETARTSLGWGPRRRR